MTKKKKIKANIIKKECIGLNYYLPASRFWFESRDLCGFPKTNVFIGNSKLYVVMRVWLNAVCALWSVQGVFLPLTSPPASNPTKRWLTEDEGRMKDHIIQCCFKPNTLFLILPWIWQLDSSLKYQMFHCWCLFSPAKKYINTKLKM